MSAKKGFQTIEEINNTLNKKLEDIFKSERFNEMLKIMSTFRQYSFNNTIMIVAQKPDATMINGYRAWQELGRNVNKGEKSIKILAPSFRNIEMEKIDKETQKPIIGNDGKPVTEKIKMITGFTPVSVFDVSQTNGKEIPNVRDFVNRDLQNDKSITELYESFKAHINHEGKFSASEDITEKGVGGYFRPSTNEIVVSNTENKNGAEKFRVLVHEYAHAKLHNLEGEFKDVSRSHKEAQAESVAYMVSNYYGLPTDDISVGYIATWAKDIELARKALQQVQSVSNDVIDVLDDLQQEKVHAFYQKNENTYSQVVDSIKDRFQVSINSLDQKNPNVQFEIVQKDRGNVMSAKLEYSDRIDKFQVRLNNNRIIPLDEFSKDGNYALLNKELINGENKVLEASYQKVSNFSIDQTENGKFIILDHDKQAVSSELSTKQSAEKHLLRLDISQSLHQQVFLKAQELSENVEKRFNDLSLNINHKVGEYLTKDTNKVFYPRENGGTTIGWTLMKRPDIQNLNELKSYVEDTKHLSGNKNLRNAMENASEMDRPRENDFHSEPELG